jgi:hypothetical protein
MGIIEENLVGKGWTIAAIGILGAFTILYVRPDLSTAMITLVTTIVLAYLPNRGMESTEATLVGLQESVSALQASTQAQTLMRPIYSIGPASTGTAESDKEPVGG